MRRSSRIRSGFTLLELFVSLAILSLVLALSLPAMQSAREAARQSTCLDHVRQFLEAEQNYDSAYGHLPDVDFWHGSGMRPATYAYASHHMRLLPFLDQGGLYQSINQDDWSAASGYSSPPESDRNAAILKANVPVFLCPSDDNVPGSTNYRVCIGTSPGLHEIKDGPEEGRALLGFGAGRSASGGGYIRRIRDISDGLSTTVAVSERVTGGRTSKDPFRDIALGVAGSFYRPSDVSRNCRDFVTNESAWYSFAGTTWLYGIYPHTGYNHVLGPNTVVVDCVGDGHMVALVQGSIAARSYHAGGVNVAFADGSARFVSDGISLPVWRGMASVAGQEKIPSY